MRITIEYEKCVGTGSCAVAAPDVFDQKIEDSSVILLEENPDESLRSAVEEAVAACPAACIHLED